MLDTFLEKTSASILPDGGGMIHTHISNARMTAEKKTFSLFSALCYRHAQGP